MGETAVQQVLPDPTAGSVHFPTIDRGLNKPVWSDGSVTAKLMRGNNEEMSYVSTCAGDYIKHALPVIPDLRGKVSALVTTAESAPFTAQSEHRDNFTPFNKNRVRHRTRRGQLQIPKVPLEKDSSYKVDFNRKGLERREPYRPREQDYSSAEPFSYTSLYRDSFKRFDSLPQIGVLPVATSAHMPVTVLQPPPLSDDFDPERGLNGTTDYRGNFLWWPPARSETVPPQFKPPTEPFASQTSYGTDFGPRPQPPKAVATKPPENDLTMKGPFQKRSLYGQDFTKKEARPDSRGIRQNRGGLMYRANGGATEEVWFHGAETTPYLEFPTQMFYQT